MDPNSCSNRRPAALPQTALVGYHNLMPHSSSQERKFALDIRHEENQAKCFASRVYPALPSPSRQPTVHLCCPLCRAALHVTGYPIHPQGLL